uniref:Phosphoglucomutase n=1 Tax=Rhizophora mucronata TaxID=61149 RepID=A0A2P2IPC9_RHIMU
MPMKHLLAVKINNNEKGKGV